MASLLVAMGCEPPPPSVVAMGLHVPPFRLDESTSRVSVVASIEKEDGLRHALVTELNDEMSQRDDYASAVPARIRVTLDEGLVIGGSGTIVFWIVPIPLLGVFFGLPAAAGHCKVQVDLELADGRRFVGAAERHWVRGIYYGYALDCFPSMRHELVNEAIESAVGSPLPGHPARDAGAGREAPFGSPVFGGNVPGGNG
jgi:hypothetical protein